jgi:hypothetical protein
LFVRPSKTPLQQQSLFETSADQIPNEARALKRLQFEGETSQLSRPKRLFQDLTKKIEAARKTIAQVEAVRDGLRSRYAVRVEPLQSKLTSLQCEMLVALDHVYDTVKLSKAQQSVLEDVIRMLVDYLMVHEDCDAAFIKPFVAKHMKDDPLALELASDSADGEEAQAISKEEEELIMKEMLRDMGIDPEGFDFDAPWSKPQKRKSPKAQIKAEQDAATAAQTVRELYRKLASALHPDREPDATKRVSKTALMVRVNEAYQKQDLISLLELQIECNQIDENGLDDIADARFEQFNLALKARLKALEQELNELAGPLMLDLNVFRPIDITEKLVDLHVRQTANELEMRLARMNYDLQRLKDPKQAKQVIAELKRGY